MRSEDQSGAIPELTLTRFGSALRLQRNAFRIAEAKHARACRQDSVLTGGASGIGLALGRAFAEAGMKVMLADIEADALAAAVTQLREF